MKDEEAESKEVIEQAFASAGLKVPLLQEVLAGLGGSNPRPENGDAAVARKILVKVSATTWSSTATRWNSCEADVLT